MGNRGFGAKENASKEKDLTFSEALKWKNVMCVHLIIRLNQLRFMRKCGFMEQFSQLSSYSISHYLFVLSISSVLLLQVMESYSQHISYINVLSGISMEIKLTSWDVIILLHITGERGKSRDLREHGESM